MVCPPMFGDSPCALASRLSSEQVDYHGLTSLYTYIRVDIAHYEIVHIRSKFTTSSLQ